MCGLWRAGPWCGARPEVNPATRTPSSRTGRGGDTRQQRQRDGAHDSTSLWACDRAGAGDGLKSFRRTLIPIVRPRRPCVARLAHSSSAIVVSDSRSIAGIVDVVSNVRSRDSETTLRAAPTTPSCSKRARRPISTPEVRPETLDQQLLGRGADVCERRESRARPGGRRSSGRSPASARVGIAQTARTPARA